ncbi:hypothetical protein ACH5RR_004400 [Cinchona calisaya]|uniref:Uncharacterized protein n=1 Tax=Cinchona calisaya TaxID=153742 RepID=A0ABD3AY94_9GENT
MFVSDCDPYTRPKYPAMGVLFTPPADPQSLFNQLLELADDYSTSIVLAVAKQPGINCLEFYLEAFPNSVDRQADAPSLVCSSCFAQLPTKGIGSSSYDFETPSGICASEDQGSRGARLVRNHPTSENVIGDCSINVCCGNKTREMVANEAHNCVSDGIDISNGRLGIASVEECGDDEHEEVDIADEDAPAP